MKTLRLFALPLAAALLACTGIFPEGEGDTAVADTGSDGPDAGVHQTSSCADYLACIEVADEQEYKKVKDEYGEDGSCWDSTKSKMQDCDAECEDALAALIEDEGADVCEGTGDTGGDTGSTNDCSLDAGYWLFNFNFEEDTCGFAEAGESWYANVLCDNGDMSIEFDNLTVPLECTGSSSRIRASTKKAATCSRWRATCRTAVKRAMARWSSTRTGTATPSTSTRARSSSLGARRTSRRRDAPEPCLRKAGGPRASPIGDARFRKAAAGEGFRRR